MSSSPIYESQRPFIVLSGLPGSGKTTLGKRLASVLRLPFIDKDDILEGLFEERGIGDSAWRRQLSRRSDVIFRQEASASNGAVLVSFWHLPGMDLNSGTPTDWLTDLSDTIVHVRCACSVEIATQRFLMRTRHPGNLDSAHSYSDIFENFRNLSLGEALKLGADVEVDTSVEPELNEVVELVREALTISGPPK